jgi:hypothetical protein
MLKLNTLIAETLIAETQTPIAETSAGSERFSFEDTLQHYLITSG